MDKNDVLLCLGAAVCVVLLSGLAFDLSSRFSHAYEKKFPKTSVQCSDMNVWESRGSYDSFNCEASNLGQFPIYRICEGKNQVVVVEEGLENMRFEEATFRTNCVETCFENCEHGWR